MFTPTPLFPPLTTPSFLIQELIPTEERDVHSIPVPSKGASVTLENKMVSQRITGATARGFRGKKEKFNMKEEEKDDKGKLDTYEIKIKNYDEEIKLRKKEKKEAEEM